MWTETVSSQKICSDNRCKKPGPSAPTRAHKAANTPVVPPRPTEKALKAKRSQPRKQYVELDLSNGSTTLQEGQTSYRTSHGNRLSSPVKPAQKPAGKQQRATVGTPACATTAGSTGGVSENPLASSKLVQQPLKDRSQVPCTGYPSNSLSRTAASHRSSVPQAASGNSLRRERMKVTVINVREPDYTTSKYTRTTLNHRKPPAPTSVRPRSTPPPQTVKKPDPPKRPEPPKSRLEERGPMPLPRSKNPPRVQVTRSLPSLTSKQEYEYIDTELRRVVYTPASTNAVHSASLKLNSNGPGVYTALDQLTMDKRNVYANLNKEIPFPEKSVSTESTPCEPLYVTMNPATPTIPSEEKKRENEMAVEDEYETSELYENVPETASLQSRDSGIYAPLITSMMDEFIMMEKSAIVEHVWENHHPIHWEETTVLDHGRGQELLVKEALHIKMIPTEERFNQDGGLEVPGCWTAVMRSKTASPSGSLAPLYMAPNT